MLINPTFFFAMVGVSIISYLNATKKDNIPLKVIALVMFLAAITYPFITPTSHLPTSDNLTYVDEQYFTINYSAYLPSGAGTIVSNTTNMLFVYDTKPLIVYTTSSNNLYYSTIASTFLSTITYNNQVFTYAESFYEKPPLTTIPGTGISWATYDGLYYLTIGILAGGLLGLLASASKRKCCVS